MTDGRTVLYLMGQDRSGSTILGQVLGELEGCAHLGEIRNVWRAGLVREGLCGCGRSVRSCELWSRAVPMALGAETEPSEVVAWLRASLRLRNLGPFLESSPGSLSGVPGAAEYVALAGRLYEALFHLTGARVLVDSSKHPVYAALLARVPRLDVRFAQLVRDPRATAYSWGRRTSSPGRPDDEMWRVSAWRAARAWVLANGAADRVRRRYPERSMLLRYEDAMADPSGAVSALATLAGGLVGKVPVGGDGTVELGSQHSAAGNPVRLQSGRVELREDEAWRTGLRPRDRRVVMALTMPFLHRYGYPIRRPTGSGA
jgi:hypothetical protein